MNAPNPQLPLTHSSRRRRWLFWILLLAILPAILIAISLVVASQMGSRGLQEAIARAERLDAHWRLDQVEADRKPLPPQGKNGIDQLIAIHDALPPAYGIWPFPQYENQPEKLAEARNAMDKSFFDDRSPSVLNEEQVRVLRTEQMRASRSAGLARELVNFPYGRFPLVYAKNFWGTMLTHSQKARSAASVLRNDAILRAHDGDMHGALQDIKAIFHASRGLGDEPLLISQLINIAIDSVGVRALERTLGLGIASEADLREIQAYLLEQASVPYFLIGVRGERAGDDLLFERIQENELTVNEFGALGVSTGLPKAFEKLLLMYTSVTIQQQRAEVLNLMTDAVEIGNLPPEKQKAAFDLWEKKVKSLNRWHIARLILPAAGKVAEADIRTKAGLRTAAVAIAAERYRMANGHWPARLDELVPKFLKELPTDPFDGQPLKTTQKDGSFVVYSIGMDRIDNGGQIDQAPFQPGSDIGFRLFDPGKRRQPARPFKIGDDSAGP